MKRIISIFTAMVVALCSAASFVYADTGRFTADTGSNSAEAIYATREQAIACFIRAVGMERFSTDPSILNNFSDSTKVSFALREEMAAAVFSGLISGYEDRTLRPQAPITRIEALVILNRALSRTELSDLYDVEFSDTPYWATPQINRLAGAGIIKGYGDGTLGANDFMTLEQVNTLCERISRFTGPTGNFYNYVNEAWLKDASTSDSAIVSDMSVLSGRINYQLTDIIFSLYRRHYNDGEEFAASSPESRIITVYSAAANQGYRDKIGLTPILSLLGTVGKVNSVPELIAAMAELEKAGFPTLLSVGLDTNPYNSTEYMPSLSVGYHGIDAALAKSDGEYLSHYRNYIEKLLIISGETAENAKNYAAGAADICQRLAMASGSSKSGTNLLLDAMIYSADELKSFMPHTDINRYFSLLGIEKTDNVISYDTKPLVAADNIIAESNLPALKAYLKACILDRSALYLTSETFAAYRDYMSALYGTPTDTIPSDYATSIVEELLGWELGKLYVDMHFPETAKTAVANITNKLINEYKLLIAGCTRMSPKSREAAIRKLNTMTVNAAYPDNFEDYFNTAVTLRTTDEGGSLMEYKIEYSRAYSASCAALLKSGRKASARGWYIRPQTVNAMYDAQSNSITIPAGILQPPFFDQSAEFEENLGAIGSVIAHEISHAFDSTGAKFDEKGNLSEQWVTEDYAGFEALCAEITAGYDGIKTNLGTVDGKLTLDENLADLAGMACVLSLAGADNPKLDKLFRSYARMWRTKTTPEYGSLMLLTDSHSPAEVRVNRVLSNFDAFTKFYGVIEGDGMYIPAEDKIDVWK